MLQLFLSMDDSLLVSMSLSFSIVANEAALLSSFDLEFNVGRAYRSRNFNVDHSRDSVAWLIEWVLGLQLNSALCKLASVV